MELRYAVYLSVMIIHVERIVWQARL